MKIQYLHARSIFDSRGKPTVECDIALEDGSFGRASVPSGASVGEHEALELRDEDNYGVNQAVDNINRILAVELMDYDLKDQFKFDKRLCQIDGTKNKSRLGANAILAVSAAALKALARSENMILWRYIAKISDTPQPSLPLPMINVINGGRHANFATDIQEYMLVPLGGKSLQEKLNMTSKVFHTLGEILRKNNYSTTVGDEGGYAPAWRNGNIEPLFMIGQAVRQAGFRFGKDIAIALDVAASELFENDWYQLKADKKQLSAGEMISWYEELIHKFPIISIEDGLEQNDWQNWEIMTRRLGEKVQIVGDDLLVTNKNRLATAIKHHASNAILIKPNQIGTISETIETVKFAKKNYFNTIISHRSGETEDSLLAHLAVGLDAGQIKTGSICRGERTTKYNELIRIAEQF